MMQTRNFRSTVYRCSAWRVPKPGLVFPKTQTPSKTTRPGMAPRWLAAGSQASCGRRGCRRHQTEPSIHPTKTCRLFHRHILRQVKIDGDQIGEFDSQSGSIVTSLGIEEDDVRTVTLEAVGIGEDEWISLLEVRLLWSNRFVERFGRSVWGRSEIS